MVPNLVVSSLVPAQCYARHSSSIGFHRTRHSSLSSVDIAAYRSSRIPRAEASSLEPRVDIPRTRVPLHPHSRGRLTSCWSDSFLASSPLPKSQTRTCSTSRHCSSSLLFSLSRPTLDRADPRPRLGRLLVIHTPTILSSLCTLETASGERQKKLCWRSRTQTGRSRVSGNV